MSVAFRRRTSFACFGLVAIVLAMVLTRVAAKSPGVLEACINPGNGMMRLVDASTACHANETRVEWSITGPAGPTGPTGATGPTGPEGPTGPQGESGGSSGPPFVWVCTPANYDFGNNGQAEIDIFNGSGTTANVAAHFFAKDGTNLAGATIPVTNPPVTYPGQTGATTVPVAANNTLIIPYQSGGGVRASSNALLASVSVTSDQSIVVGMNIFNGPPQGIPCSLQPK